MARRRRAARAPLKPRPNVRLSTVIDRLEAEGRPYDRQLIESVYEFTKRLHRDQKRRSGDPYIVHPLYVAYILADLKFDQTSVIVGLLHDVLEDTLATKEVLKDKFGEEVADLVDGVTKIGKQEYVRKDEAQAETFRKMILASARDLRVILVKLADRLHNMLTLEHMTPEARRRIAAETLEIYSPIAHRLGMSKVQGDLEDLAFFHRYPLQFAELEAKVSEKMRVAKGSIQRIRNRLQESLETAEVDAEISYRVKRFYSIYRKLRRQGIDISQLYDYLAFRIITGNLKDSYAAFGIVHQNWRPIPGRFKDYIAMPKANLYQSLHTTVVGNRGQPFEIQIRTQEMDIIAEEGIAAHWRYKQGADVDGDPNILWLRQLLEWQKEIEDPREFLTALKIDLYPEEVYVFTPRGDVFSFPRGATPLDFAYRIHTDLGHRCSGARVNGKLVPLKSRLNNGDMVEVLTSPNRQPSRDWLSFVGTSRARSKIRNWLNTEQTREARAIGRRLLERELKKQRFSPRRILEGKRVEEYLREEGLTKIEDLFQKIGYGKAPVKQVIRRLVGSKDADQKEERPGPLRWAADRLFSPGSGPITVKGEGDLMSSLAKCCAPVPGEEVLGYVTRGRGITVHSMACSNIKNLVFDPERLIEVEWAQPANSVFPVSLAIEVVDHPGMLARLTEVIAKESSNIRLFEAEAFETGRGVIEVVAEVKNRKHLDRLKRAISAIRGVTNVSRRTKGASSERALAR